ncbi:MAG TPA: phosphatase PAP2 family protein [Phnomibacter sp.]|nr:phosphatase PAP2 family protein [Phnomibacter sp.]
MHPLRFFLLLCCFLTGVFSVVGQADSSRRPLSLSYLASYPRNMVAMVRSPAGWDREKWFQVGGSVILVGALIPMDEVLNIPFENWDTPGGEKFGETGDAVGDLPFQFGITGLAMGVGLVANNKQWQQFALDNLQAQLFTGGITWIVKELTHRARPYTENGNYAWYGPFSGSGHTSFFSGHTSLAFSTATMIFLHSGRKWWVGALGYGVASGVGLSRMQQQQHWASDVLAGALVGTAVSGFIYRQQEKRRSDIQKLKPLP